MTQWGDIATTICVVFVGIVAMLVIAVYVERWLGTPAASPPGKVSALNNEINESDDYEHLA